MRRNSRPLRQALTPLTLGLALLTGTAAAHAADADILGRYVAKDAEFVIEKAPDNEYRMQYYGKCIREGEPFEFFTNGKARRLTPRSFAISVTASRVPSCARFAPLDGQDHILEQSPDNPALWRFKRNEPSWLTKLDFMRQK